MLGMAVRSVQLMVDRGLLQAWRTPGGHRRIDSRSVQRWLGERTNQLNSQLNSRLDGHPTAAGTLEPVPAPPAISGGSSPLPILKSRTLRSP